MREAVTHELVRTQAVALEATGQTRLRRAHARDRMVEWRRRREIYASICIFAITMEGVLACAVSSVAPWITLVLALPMLLAWLPWPGEREQSDEGIDS